MYKKILSFDVGIRNLGVALVEYKFDKKNIETVTTTTTTTAALIDDSKTLGYPWSKLKITDLQLIDIVAEVCQGKKQRANAKPKTAKSININDICHGIVNILFKRLSWLTDITDILVEQQLILRGGGKGGSMGSARMKVIQHCILTFYDTYYILHPELVKPLIAPASPANKLKCIIDEKNIATAPLMSTDKNTDYKQRKAKAVENFFKFIDWCDISQNLKVMFTDIKKQNDLADCVLQALHEIQLFGSVLLKKESKVSTVVTDQVPKVKKPRQSRKKKAPSPDVKETPQQKKEPDIKKTDAKEKPKQSRKKPESKLTESNVIVAPKPKKRKTTVTAT